ncbi:MAG: 23S rRNA (adenine(2503)-C(2))-methyltransferase RlmN [Bacteroidia bacterium]|nr:23S rRNA (adenine(2503)-C(2))-methyltransferase RlmN [Bacteroidia bacterium]
MPDKKNIRALSDEDLMAWLAKEKEPAFRSKQIKEWIWKKAARNFREMKNLPSGLIEKLENEFELGPVRVNETQISSDGTIKAAMLLSDGLVVESVLIPKGKRMTACVSSQVGCSLSCKFCATARIKRKRNLLASEIFDQVVLMDRLAREHYGQALTHIVYMGMGEPLLNFKEVVKSVRIITSPEGLGMSPSRITISTAGIAKMIRALADENLRVNLALSLHAPDDAKRSQIMPINEVNPLEDLKDALRYFYNTTGIRPTLEYVALRGFNDTPEDARKLLTVTKSIVSKINIIQYNPIDGGEFLPSYGNQLKRFTDLLKKGGAITTIRRSRGKDIDAACGQLANKNKLSEQKQ